ncbi:hypothetical protein B0H13DRAFT_2270212 [Mycena leptocephala]|nr:hypothetical protein B0H13DRAFT_2270212 [Mycena leptocephala]
MAGTMRARKSPLARAQAHLQPIWQAKKRDVGPGHLFQLYYDETEEESQEQRKRNIIAPTPTRTYTYTDTYTYADITYADPPPPPPTCIRSLSRCISFGFFVFVFFVPSPFVSASASPPTSTTFSEFEPLLALSSASSLLFGDTSISPMGTLSWRRDEFKAALPCPSRRGVKSPVGTLSSRREEFKAAEPSMRGVKSPVGTLSSNRDEFKAAPPCIPPPPCAPPYPYASVGAVGVGTGVLKAGAGTLSDPGVGTLSDDAAYPLSPPVSEGVLASEVDISKRASPKAGMGSLHRKRGYRGPASGLRLRWRQGRRRRGARGGGLRSGGGGLVLESCSHFAVRDEGAEPDDSAASASSVLSPGASGMGDWSCGVFRSTSASAAASESRVDTEVVVGGKEDSRATLGCEGRRPEVAWGAEGWAEENEGEGGAMAEEVPRVHCHAEGVACGGRGAHENRETHGDMQQLLAGGTPSARLGMYDCALARSGSCGASSGVSGSRCAGNPPGTSGPGVPTGVCVTCPPRTSFMFSAHSLAGVCGSGPEEMVGTKLGREGWIAVILDYFHWLKQKIETRTRQ